MIAKVIAVAAMLPIMACAGAQKAAPPVPAPPEPKVAPAPAPQPEDDAQEGTGAAPAAPLGDLHVSIQAPSGDWVSVPQEQIQDDALMVLVNEKDHSVIQVHLHQQPGSDAVKVTQVMAIGLIMSGFEPLDLTPDADGSHADLTLRFSTDKGMFIGLLDVRASSLGPNVYVVVSCLWQGDSVDPATLAAFRKAAASVTVVSD